MVVQQITGFLPVLKKKLNLLGLIFIHLIFLLFVMVYHRVSFWDLSYFLLHKWSVLCNKTWQVQSFCRWYIFLIFKSLYQKDILIVSKTEVAFFKSLKTKHIYIYIYICMYVYIYVYIYMYIYMISVRWQRGKQCPLSVITNRQRPNGNSCTWGHHAPNR